MSIDFALAEPIPINITSSGASRSPGPASYTTRPHPLSDIPKINMHQRTTVTEDLNTAPYRDTGTFMGKGSKYTLKGRHDLQVDATPGPAWQPPPFGSGALSPTVHGKLRDPAQDVTPGPGTYESPVRCGDQDLKTTMHGPTDKSPPNLSPNSPGAASYFPKLPEPVSIGIGKQFSPSKSSDDTPGPGRYSLPDVIRPDKERGRIHNRIERDYSSTSPGPAEYRTRRDVLDGVPRVFMHSRPEQRTEANTAPYRNTRRSASESPRYSMRSRYSQSGDETPGVAYVPPPFATGSPRAAIRPRYKVREPEQTPGAPHYRPRTGTEVGNAQKSTMHGPKERLVVNAGMGPSGADYSVDCRGVKERAPVFTIKGAKYEPARDRTGEYVSLGSTLRGPGFSMKGRPTLGISYS
jgi:hypothetical protein